MTVRTKTIDDKCFELAESFLADEQGLNNATARYQLARIIQEAIWDEIEWMRNRREIWEDQ